MPVLVVSLFGVNGSSFIWGLGLYLSAQEPRYHCARDAAIATLVTRIKEHIYIYIFTSVFLSSLFVLMYGYRNKKNLI